MNKQTAYNISKHPYARDSKGNIQLNQSRGFNMINPNLFHYPLPSATEYDNSIKGLFSLKSSRHNLRSSKSKGSRYRTISDSDAGDEKFFKDDKKKPFRK